MRELQRLKQFSPFDFFQNHQSVDHLWDYFLSDRSKHSLDAETFITALEICAWCERALTCFDLIQHMFHIYTYIYIFTKITGQALKQCHCTPEQHEWILFRHVLSYNYDRRSKSKPCTYLMGYTLWQILMYLLQNRGSGSLIMFLLKSV